ncbi:MAG: hypothetical protein AABZ53_09845 [Planctomycetota bacterium]
MRRGDQPRVELPEGQSFTKAELLEAGDISAKTFDLIRKAARVRGPGHGGLNWVFSLSDVQAIIHRAEGGTFTERGAPAAALWRAMLAERGLKPVGDALDHSPGASGARRRRPGPSR